MNKTIFFLVSVAMIGGSCGAQMDYTELQTSGTVRLRSQAAEFFNNKEYDKAIDAYEILLAKTESPKSVDYFNLGRCYYITNSLERADSVFTLLIKRSPDLSVGYLWRARTRSRIDVSNNEFLAKPDFVKIIELGGSDPKKFANDLKEAYHYFGYYYLMKSEYKKARDCFNQILMLEPDKNQTLLCNEALKALDKLEK